TSANADAKAPRGYEYPGTDRWAAGTNTPRQHEHRGAEENAQRKEEQVVMRRDARFRRALRLVEDALGAHERNELARVVRHLDAADAIAQPHGDEHLLPGGDGGIGGASEADVDADIEPRHARHESQ